MKGEKITLSDYSFHIRFMAGDIVCARSYNQNIPNINLFWFSFNSPVGNYFGFRNCFRPIKLFFEATFKSFVSAVRNNHAWIIHHNNRHGLDLVIGCNI